VCPQNVPKPATCEPASSRRRRPRRDLRCPRHPDQRLCSVSPKRYLAVSSSGELRCGPVQRERFLIWASRQDLTPLADNWIEAFHCPACNGVLYWHLSRAPSCELCLLPLPDGVLDQLRQQGQDN